MLTKYWTLSVRHIIVCTAILKATVCIQQRDPEVYQEVILREMSPVLSFHQLSGAYIWTPPSSEPLKMIQKQKVLKSNLL